MVQGMPLAILLAAAWMEVLSPAEIAEQVERGLAFLEVDWRGVEQRHRSMVAVFDASWEMLTATERAAFKRLSVFRGGFTAKAAEAVAGASLHTLRGLAHKLFLGRGEDGRYEVHELLRQYAERKLEEMPGDRQKTFDRHCAYYAQFLAQRGDSFRKRGPGDALAEMANIRATWGWALQHARLPELRRSLDGIWLLLDLRGSQNREKSALLTQAVDLLRRAEPSRENQIALGLALCYLAFSKTRIGLREGASLLAQEGLSLLRRRATGRVLARGYILAVLGGVTVDEPHAKSLLEQGLAIAQEADGPREVCWARNLLAGIAMCHQEYDQAEGHLLKALRIAQEIGHRRGQAVSLGDLGELAYLQGEYTRARAFHEQSLVIFREMGERWWIVSGLNALGEDALAARDLEQARARCREALSLSEELADFFNMAQALCGLGEVALATGDVPAARRCYRHALQVALEDSFVGTGRRALGSVARFVAHQGEPELAVELAALVLNVRPGLWRETLHSTEAFLSELQSGLSPDVYAAAEARGRARDLEATMAELLAEFQDEP
jgi:tetratricopeptide (TPR) repeat protein